MPLPAQRLRFVPADDKTVMAPELSLRGGQRPTWRPEREARGSALGVQSRSTRLHRGKVTGEIATAFPRLPRRFAPRNDTSGGYCGAPAPSSGLIPLCKALNERRYRRNRSVRFYRHLVRTGSAFPRLPRRFAPRNDTSGGCGGAPELSSGLMPLCKAVTDRRYRRNWSVRFIDALYELQVPSRDCHVALLLAMTRQAAWWCTSAPMLLNVPLLGAH